jgi:arsenate reductase (glutaredoxin)
MKHFVPLMSLAVQVKRFTDRFGKIAGLLDTEGKELVDAGLKYLKVSESELLLHIERTPKLLRLPLVRGPGKHLAVGHDEAAWKAMLEP